MTQFGGMLVLGGWLMVGLSAAVGSLVTAMVGLGAIIVGVLIIRLKQEAVKHG